MPVEKEDLTLAAGTPIRQRWEVSGGYQERFCLLEVRRFQVVRKIGQGGFGAVYLIYDWDTKKECALKVESANARHQLLKMEVSVLRRFACIYISDFEHLCFSAFHLYLFLS